MTTLPPWKKPRKKTGNAKTKLTPQQIALARARAEANGRRYPNLIDNMWAACLPSEIAKLDE